MSRVLCIVSVVLSALFASGSDLVEKAKLVEGIVEEFSEEELAVQFFEASSMKSSLSMLNATENEEKKTARNKKLGAQIKEKLDAAVLGSYSLQELQIMNDLSSKGEVEKSLVMKILLLALTSDSQKSMELMTEFLGCIFEEG